mmetsp:Transcript_15118/g.39021  ORF Transcript_15118/g.39021 Transcript_15118/m.39021 type:complete len:128 (+) Transcript_15118:1065-1448(+)
MTSPARRTRTHMLLPPLAPLQLDASSASTTSMERRRFWHHSKRMICYGSCLMQSSATAVLYPCVQKWPPCSAHLLNERLKRQRLQPIWRPCGRRGYAALEANRVLARLGDVYCTHSSFVRRHAAKTT